MSIISEGTLAYLLALVAAYLFFCAVSADPKGQATVYVGNPLFGISQSVGPTRDPSFRFFGWGPMFWTLVLMLLVRYNPGHCSLNPSEMVSFEALLGVLTVVWATKILFGPVVQVRKSIKLVGDRSFVQPISFIVFDALRTWPANVLDQFAWKLIAVSIMAFIIWFTNGRSSIRPDDVIPLPLALAWVLACFGRVAGFILHQKPPYQLQLAFYVVTFIAVLAMWSVTEALLKSCGGEPGVLPSLGSLIAGFVGLLLMETIVDLAAAMF